MKTLQVKYETKSIDDKFDGKIIKFVENELGYKWLSQGYYFKTKERDINFERSPFAAR